MHQLSAGYEQLENQTENLLAGDLHGDAAFETVPNSTGDRTGPTVQLLKLDAQDDSMSRHLLNLEVERVDDPEYLLKSIGEPQGQVCA